MRRIAISLLKPGDVLGQPVRNERGDVLLQAGVLLTPELVSALHKRRFYTVYINDGLADDVIPQDIVSDRVRAVTVRHIADLFHAGTVAGRGKKDAIAQERHTLTLLEAVRRDVDLILNDVLDGNTLTGITALKSHDDYTFSHSVDVAVIAILLGRTLRLSRDELRQLALGALLHDIGKMFVPDELLNKPGPLTDDEMRTMQHHTVLGFNYLTDGAIGDYVASHIAFQHHERQDGCGYPRGLHGTNRLRRDERERYYRDRIHPLAEVAAVADVYSALSSDRPYRPAMTPEMIGTTLRQMAGAHLNDEALDAFFRTVPIFPVGAPVQLAGGRYDGYRGVVVENVARRLDRPIVRLTLDPLGRTLVPDDLDTATEPDGVLLTPEVPAPSLLAAVG
ncbi:MAG: HD-GYP domain-containing protein [Dehalococcoidia bacterium]